MFVLWYGRYLQGFQGTAHGLDILLHDVSKYFGGLHIGMPHEFLDDTNVYSVFEQISLLPSEDGPLSFGALLVAMEFDKEYNPATVTLVLSYTNSDGISGPGGPDPSAVISDLV